MSEKTSTAALGTFRRSALQNPLRVPRHLAGARVEGPKRSKAGREAESLRFQQAQIAIHQEHAMNRIGRKRLQGNIFPVILRIAFSLLLWTLGAATMRVAAAERKALRVVYTFAVDRAQVEDLQRWVNAGHDVWCSDPQLVAAAALRRVSPEFEDYEFASMPIELERARKREATYAFHSLDGLTTYRITLRRYPWRKPSARSLRQRVWVPERAEIVTCAALD